LLGAAGAAPESLDPPVLESLFVVEDDFLW